MDAIAHALAQVSSLLAGASSGPVALVGVFMVEGIMKLWPTSNPQGILLKADQILKKSAGLISQLGDVCAKLDGVVGAIVPQNIQPPK